MIRDLNPDAANNYGSFQSLSELLLSLLLHEIQEASAHSFVLSHNLGGSAVKNWIDELVILFVY